MRRRWLHNDRARAGPVTVDQPRQIAELTRRRGPLTPIEVADLVTTLEQAFPPA